MMKQMKIENNSSLTYRYYSNVLKQATQYGIDCKVYGAICAVSEIKNAVPLVHGPEGCAYYPRFFPTDAIRMKLLGERHHPPIYSTAMTEPHVIYGGENRLEEAIIELDRKEKPELIGVIGSCVPAIIGDDLEEVVSRVRNKISAAIIATPSSGYDDDRAERQYIDDFAKNTLNAWNSENKEELKFGIEKCGRLDAMYSLVEQLTEDVGYKVENSVNIDTFGRLHYYEDLKGEIEEIIAVLSKIGIKVNTVFPGCSLSDIKRMPAAELNFMRRSENAAKFMQKKYDMDYLFDPLCVRYAGLDGIERFYMDIATKFNLEGKAEGVLSKEKSALKEKLRTIRKLLRDKAFSVVLVPMTISVEYLKVLEFIGLKIKALFINTEWLERFGTKKGYTGAIAKELSELASELGIEEVFINLDAFEEVKKAKERGVDLALVDTLTEDEERTMLYEHNGVKAISPSLYGYSPYRISYAMITRLGEGIVRKLQNRLPKRKLLFFEHAVDGWRFPCLEDTLHCRICWEEMMHVWRS
ncbi:MAG: nitrogenase component 1 [Methanophagales archaeon]|nr:nitrogenase component 1 [Methanophagales archaeon]